MPQPGDADAVPGPETVGTLAELDHLADDLMTGNHCAVPGWQLALGQVKVGAADPTGTNSDQHLAPLRNRHGRSTRASGDWLIGPGLETTQARIMFVTTHPTSVPEPVEPPRAR